MHLKKWLALLVSAALALALLAGCGNGGKALSRVFVDLLEGQYQNLSVQTDSKLEAALKKAVKAGGTQEEIYAALLENLGLAGKTISFSYGGFNGAGVGEQAVALTFLPGEDETAAARSALNGWNSVLGSLPKDGNYRAHVSMIEAENGYYIAVDVEVLKAGRPDNDDNQDSDGDDNKDNEDGEDGTTSYTQETDTNGNITKVTINTKNGLQQLVDNLAEEGKDPATALAAASITLNCDVTLDDTWIPIGTEQNPYTGTFNGNDKTISGLNVSSNAQYVGLFGYIQDGTVQNLTLDTPTVKSTYTSITTGEDFGGTISIGYVGAVTGFNGGTIENCHITGGTISASAKASNVGGVVGYNAGSVTGCSSTGNVTADKSGDTFAGGVVGFNFFGSITACYSTGDVNGHRAGGVVGYNFSFGTITACYATGNVTGGSYAGGVAGENHGTITACYWSGTVKQNDEEKSDQGIGFGTGTAIHVTEENWAEALEGLNGPSNTSGYHFGGSTMNAPTLIKN